MSSQASALTPIRRHDIDWLRILATLALILFEAAVMSFPGMTAGHGARGSSLQGPPVLFMISQWYVPLAFLISGWSRKSPLQHHSGRDSIRERFIRLGIPFFAGVLLISPAARFLELGGVRATGQGRGAPGQFPAFLLDFFTLREVFAWYDLWFLLYLFVFSVVTWPFFSGLLGKKVTPMKASPWWVYLPLVPLSMIQLAGGGLLQPGSHGGLSGSMSFLAYFVIGFVVSRYSAYERAMHQEAVRSGVMGAAVLGALAVFSQRLPVEAARFMSAAGGWLVVVGILGLAKKYLDRPSVPLSYLRKAVFPVFLLHHVPLAVLSAAVAASPAPAALKLVLLASFTLGTALALHHFVIRRSSVLGLLFGVKPEEEQPEGQKDKAQHRDRC